MSYIRLLSFKLLALLLVACASQKKTSEVQTSAPAQEAQESTEKAVNFTPSNKVGSNIIAEVIEIKRPPEVKNPSSVCEKVACTAYLEVERLEKVGRFFDYSFAEGDKIGAYFTFSLVKTTKELFPNSEVSYPGLKVGDRIRAYVLIQSPVSDFPYTIDHYEILP